MGSNERRSFILRSLALKLATFGAMNTKSLAQVHEIDMDALCYNLKRAVSTSAIAFNGPLRVKYIEELNEHTTSYIDLLNWLNTKEVCQISDSGLRKQFLLRISDDISTERVVCVDGWWLSLTEFNVLRMARFYT